MSSVRLRGASVAPNFFEVIGVQAVLGRTFQTGDSTEAIVISDTLWRTRFGADPTVLGRALPLEGQSRVIIGVLPSGFRFTYPQETEFWSLRPDTGLRAMALEYHVVARLRAGISVEQANAAMSRLSALPSEAGRDSSRVLSTQVVGEWVHGRMATSVCWGSRSIRHSCI